MWQPSSSARCRIEAALGVRPTPSDEASRTILSFSTGWMDVLTNRTRDISVLARDPAFSEIGRALADVAELAPDLMADATVETARASIASVGTPKQVEAVSAALPELWRIVVSLFRRPRHPGWPGLAAVLLSLQAFKADAEEREDDPLVVLTDRLLDVHSDREAFAAAAGMLGALEHRARAAVVSGMLDDVARCILQSTVLSGRGLESFGEQLLSEANLHGVGAGREARLRDEGRRKGARRRPGRLQLICGRPRHMADEPSRGELSEAIMRILASGTSRAVGRHHYAHVRSPRGREDVLGIVVPWPARSLAHPRPNDRRKSGKA
uniref:hypothetical protein n=1 Tax=Methylobacterium sp. B34 TaxID=95563 RepID=UPI000679C98D|nr:hypothetical protein [Methylobacterium sp. B34]